MKRGKYWFILVAVVILGLVGWYFLRQNGTQKMSYRFDKVDRGEVVVSVSATGSLNADTTVQVGTQVSGIISRLYADFNSQVKKGQLLALLDTTFLEAALEQQRANTDRAVATLNDAQRTYDRTKGLFEKTLTSQADLDASTTALEQAKAGLRQAQASLHQAEVNLAYATITAPISGVIVSRNVDVGQTVAASLSAPTLFEIANDLRKMQVSASVDEADVGSIKEGQSVSFRVDAYPDDVFNGTVGQIRLAPVVTQNVVTYNVIINVDNPDLKLLPGMTATVTIETARRDDALRVPIQAVRFTPPDVDMSQFTGRGPKAGQPANGARAGDSTKPAGDGAMAATRPSDSSGGGKMRQQWGKESRARVWIMENGMPRPVWVGKGIQNTRYVEVFDTRLKEGDSVMVGVSGGGAQGTQQGTNPFMPRMGGGGGGPRR